MTYNASSLIQLSKHYYNHSSPTRNCPDAFKRITKSIAEIWTSIKSVLFTAPNNKAQTPPQNHVKVTKPNNRTPKQIILQDKIQKALETLERSNSPTIQLFSIQLFSKSCVKLKNQEIQAILSYVQDKSQNEAKIIRSYKSGLARTLFYDGQKWYLLLTKSNTFKDPLLGEGGFKKVKYAIDLSTGEKVALAVIRNHEKIAREEIELHQRTKDLSETVRLRASIQCTPQDKLHPGKTVHKTYLILDLCDQRDLYNLLISKSALKIQQASSLALDCAKGVAALHKQNILHRDLKPENIFLYTGENNQLRAKIGDLGLSCEIGSNKTTEEAGTAIFFSPEKARASLKTGSDDRASAMQNATTTQDDIWALGLIFFALFSKNETNNGDYPSALKDKTGKFSINAIAFVTEHALQKSINTELKNDTPSEIRQLITSMLSIDPKNRPTAEEVFQTLQTLQPPKTT